MRFNGGPDNCPAKRAAWRRRVPSGRACFNGGPDNCPAKPPPGRSSRQAPDPLQWRAGQLPGQTAPSSLMNTLRFSLQWRAGQLPGQTGDLHVQRLAGANASMEGRTIARPNPTPRSWWASASPGFNGGPDNCPAKPASPPRSAWTSARFNGGPDNCPAKPGRAGRTDPANPALQWRAGQLPGQTSGDTRIPRRHEPASMEGRTIARPNRPPDGVTCPR